MRGKVLVVFLMSCLLATGCLKPLESEGVTGSMTLKGCVVESESGTAAAGVNVLATNGERNGDEAVSAADGSFSLAITYEQLNEGYYLLLYADSLYETTSYALRGMGYGLKEYDLQSISVNGPELPLVATDEVSAISQTSAVAGGTIVSDGRSAIRRKGVCWSTAATPTIVNEHADAGIGMGHFAVALSNLQQGATYHVRAYAENGVGISYGEDVTFTTHTGVPTVSTAAVSQITQHGATCGGVVTSDNGNSVTARGVCYSATSVEPTVHDAHTVDGAGTGSFVSTITDLQSGTTYYLRAYATSAAGSGYGEVKIITTF